MREIKFKQYIEDYDAIIQEKYWRGIGIYEPFLFDREEYGQEFAEYTEVKDDDGVEIYEGDILSNSFMDSYENHRSIVIREDYAWKVTVKGVSRPLMDNQGWCSIREKRYGGVKVIGNKWEDPELIPRSKKDTE